MFPDAVLAAALLAIDPPGLGGMVVRAWSGLPREGFLRHVATLFPPGAPAKKMPAGITDDRLQGGIDIAATLAAGKPIYSAGLLAETENGVLQLAMAERLSPGAAGKIAAVLDGGARIAMIALDEGIEPDEAPPACLLDRLAFTVTALPPEDAPWPTAPMIRAAATRRAGVTAAPEMVEQICAIAAMLGISSLRAPIFAIRAARAAAALQGRSTVDASDIALAARLVLAPRATQIPGPPPAAPPPEDESEPQPDQQLDGDKPLEDRVEEAQKAALPPELLAALAGVAPRRMARGAGTSGRTLSQKRGRPAGARRGALGGDAKLSLIETLRAAAPWQKLRRKAPGRKIAVLKDDFRIKKFKENPRTIAIFAVDASGSSAINRLAEAKGAIQLLLADCYVRRDQVSLIAFRGRAAEILLPPTHALARAKRALAGLPGGGPTPLAAGIDAARLMAGNERRAGKLPLLVLLTDGGANIGRDGQPGRAPAAADALAAARQCRADGFSTLVVDTSPRPQKFVQSLAAEMAARYLPLPYADAARLSQAVLAQGGAHASRR
jgi:magnesium chelatase subunit D